MLLADSNRWFRVTRAVTTEETIFVRASSRAAATARVREGEYEHGPYNPRHLRETIRFVAEAPTFSPEEYEG